MCTAYMLMFVRNILILISNQLADDEYHIKIDTMKNNEFTPIIYKHNTSHMKRSSEK